MTNNELELEHMSGHVMAVQLGGEAAESSEKAAKWTLLTLFCDTQNEMFNTVAWIV